MIDTSSLSKDQAAEIIEWLDSAISTNVVLPAIEKRRNVLIEQLIESDSDVVRGKIREIDRMLNLREVLLDVVKDKETK